MPETDETILSRLLSNSQVEAVHDIYTKHDAAAIAAQSTFRRYSLIFIAATALASLVAALILLGSGADPGAGGEMSGFLADPSRRDLLFTVEVAALMIAAFTAHIQETRQSGVRWASERRTAELCRIEFFEAIMTASKDTGPEAQTVAFEYFLSEQLDEQLNFYESAEVRHGRRSSWFAFGGAALAAIVAIAAAASDSHRWLPIAALAGVVAPVFLIAIYSWRDSTNDQEKAERYDVAWTALRRLKGQSTVAQKQLDNSDAGPALAFVEEVHRILRAEHEGWQPYIKDT